MGRAGSGGGHHSSSHHSSGGHSSSRSSGGHRVGSSGSHNRAGSSHSSYSTSHRSSSYHGGGFGMPHYHSHRHVYHHYGGSPTVGAFSALITFFVIVMIFIIFTAVIINSVGNANIPASTINREKLQTKEAFDSNCIVDELDWFDSVSRAGTRLKSFYEKTGVQPYVVLLDYNPELTTDSEKEAYANAYYESHIDNEITFLFMYFAEKDTDNDVGYMCYVNGKQVNSVMDAEAVSIFWGYIDRYWYSDLSTDALFEKVFDSTAKTIMTKSKTSTDIIFVIVAGIVIVAIVIVIIIAMNTKRKNERERAEETQRILNTPLPSNPTSTNSVDSKK